MCTFQIIFNTLCGTIPLRIIPYSDKLLATIENACFQSQYLKTETCSRDTCSVLFQKQGRL